MPTDQLENLFPFLTSLAIGLLIGLERERSPAAKAGLRRIKGPSSIFNLRKAVGRRYPPNVKNSADNAGG